MKHVFHRAPIVATPILRNQHQPLNQNHSSPNNLSFDRHGLIIVAVYPGVSLGLFGIRVTIWTTNKFRLTCSYVFSL